MILQDLMEKRRVPDEHGFIKPDYGGLCFSGIPGTVAKALGVRPWRSGLPMAAIPGADKGRKYGKVVLLLVDGLGFDVWMRNSNDGGAIGALGRNGSVAPITAVFPSTTAAALSTLSTGLTPQEHGLLEWVLYMEEIDATIETLPFRPVGVRGHDLMLAAGADPKVLLDAETTYERLAREGVASYTLLEDDIADSAYSKLVNRGSTTVGYSGMLGMLDTMAKTIEKVRGSTLVYAYYGGLDSAAHDQGPDSPMAATELTILSAALNGMLFRKLSSKAAEDTLFILASDHGQVQIEPERTTYLNGDRTLMSALRKGRDGKVIPPVGGPRDLFLHVKDERVEEVRRHLERSLAGRAAVTTTMEAQEQGIFGSGEAGERFLKRAGSLMVLPKGSETVWYEHVPGRRMEMRGIHGGLSEKEMLVPLAVAEMARLRA